MQDLLFKVGPLAVYQWGLYLAISYLIGIFYFWRLGRKEGFASDSLLDLIFQSSLVGLLGGRLAFLLTFSIGWEIADLLRVSSGILWGGVFLGGASAAGVFIYLNRWSLGRIADGAFTALALGQAVGYLGAEVTNNITFGFYPAAGFFLGWLILRFLLNRGISSGYPTAFYLAFSGGLLYLTEWLRPAKALLTNGLNVNYIFSGVLAGLGVILFLILVARRASFKVKR